MYYASLADVIAISRTPGGQTSPSITAEVKSQLLRHVRMISRRVDLDLAAGNRPLFEPYIEQRSFPVTGQAVNSALQTFRFDRPLLALTAVSVGGTTLTVDSDVALYPNSLQSPCYQLRLLNLGYSWYSYLPSDGAPSFVTVSGIWGLHRDYANAWLKVDDLAAGITSSQLTFTVADTDGENAFGQTPRLSPGQLLRIDSEFVQVYKIDDGTNTLTVQRGVHGSTAAAHDAGADVEVWQVEDPIRHVVARQAAFIWSRQGAYSSTEVQGMSEIRYPPDLLAELKAAEQDYANGY